MLKSKLYLLTAILSMLALLVTACAQPVPPEAPEGNGTIIIYVTDTSPDEEITSIMVTLLEVQVHKSSAEQEIAATSNQTKAQEQEQQSQDEEGQWITIDISGNETFDLLQIKGIEQFLGERKVEEAKYTQVRLVTDKIQVKIGSGNLTDAILPSRELKIVHPFDVIDGGTTALVLDFEAEKMVPLAKADESINLASAHEITIMPVVKLMVRQEKP